jgi:beta-glucosidase
MNKSAYVGNTTFVCESVLGATWNKDLAYQMGKAVGDNGYWGDVNGNGLPYSGWYAPAVNLHRSPFSGRNFEYYSEDPILSGKMAVNVINGAAQKGVYTDLKHFALNDQETNRSGIATYCTEQALRELYLKPFEIAVKADDDATQVPSAVKDKVTEYKGTTGIMSSFNRIGTRWTGGDYRLLTEILRNEWGFKGLVISDYKTGNSYMDSRQMLYAGNDLILASLPGLLWTDASESNPQDVAILRQSAKNILYTVANSNSVNVTITGYTMEWWMATLIAVDVIVPVGLAVWGFFVIRSYIKKGKEAE